MKVVGRLLVGLSVLTLLMSCAGGYEGKGDKAYKMGQKAQGDQKRYHLKMAYIMYEKAMKANPNKISPKLRNRFFEMTLLRASMVINEGTAQSEALEYFMKDLDKNTTPELSPELKQQYALLVAQMADSSLAKERFADAAELYEKALGIANDKAPVEAKKAALNTKMARENYDIAELEFTNAKANKDVEGYIKAEYYTLLSMLYDSTNSDTKKLISAIRKENASTYSAFVRVIEGYSDTVLFRRVNKWDILLAVPTIQSKGSVSAVVNIYNNSWNPLRMRSTDFYIVDVNGKEYAAKVSKIDPEMLDQQHETKCKLSFPAPSGAIKKIIYRNGEHYSEKYLM